MKKLLVLLLVGLMMLSVSAAFAYDEGTVTKTSGPSCTVNLTAKVGPYAAIWWKNDAEAIELSGKALEWSNIGDVTACMDCNCDVQVKVTGSPFKKTVAGTTYTLTSYFRSNDWWFGSLDWHPFTDTDLAEPPYVASIGHHEYDVDYCAQAGANIYDQIAADDYKGSLTATVYKF